MKEEGRHPALVSLGFGIAPKPKTPRQKNSDDPPAPTALKARVMVVDDDAAVRRLLESRLHTRYQVTCAESPSEALDACVRSRPHLVISELRMGGPMDGLALLKELKSRWPDISVIILTAHGTIPDAVKATQNGAFGFLVKPVERDELLGQVERAIAASNFSPDAPDWRANLDARAKLLEQRLALANSAAIVNSPLLLTGLHNAGKELMARAIHAASPRRDKPFITVNCVGAPEEQLERTLFGGEDDTGSFVAGAVQKAQQGTLLLEEAEHLPLRLQARLVNEIRDSDSIKGIGQVRADVRLICTSPGDLKAAMASGQIRSDFYYLVSVMPIEVPPLGRRREDLPLLVSHLLERATEDGVKKIYTPKDIERLATNDWPPEVRNLFDLVKQGVILNQDPATPDLKVPSYEEARQQFTRDYLVNNLQRTGGNISEAARLAKRNRTDFYKLLSRFRVRADDFKPNEEPRRGEAFKSVRKPWDRH